MHPAGHDSVGPFTRSVSGTLARARDHQPRAGPSAIEHDANVAATDWQIILHLKALFERKPAIIPSLFDSADGKQPAAYLTTLITAVREAIAARPDSADLHYHAAGALLRLGKKREAETLLERALALDPDHADSPVRPAEVRTGLNRPQRAATCLRQVPGTSTASPDTPSSRRPDRRGNELPA